jgi:AcrR family transcriptional regulator
MKKNHKRVGRPEGKSREKTQKSLLVSAKSCFATIGFDATTFKQVAVETGVTPAAIYQYYSSKMALYSATLDHTLEDVLPTYFVASDNSLNIKEKITAIIEASKTIQARDKISTQFLAAIPIELQRHPELYEHLGFDSNGLIASLLSMFDEAQKAGEIRSGVNLEGLMVTVMGAIMGIALFHNGFHIGDEDQGMDTLLDMVNRYLFE